MPKLKPYSIASLLLLATLAGVNVYRAATQSITHDEALTFEFFAAPPDFYDANQHVLNSDLAWLSVSAFGLSELTLRLPSLLGGFLYFAAAFQLSRYLFGETIRQFLSVALLCLNPLLLDFLSAARGYGMAAAFLLWAVYFLVRYVREGEWLRAGALWRAGVALGLAVSANLTLLFPAVALLAVLPFLIEQSEATPQSRKQRRKRPTHTANARGRAILLTVAPFAVVCSVFLLGPLSHARRENFYAGEASLYLAIQSLVRYSFSHNGKLPESGITGLSIAASLVVAGVIAGAIVRARRSGGKELALLGGSLAVTAALLVAGRYAAGIPYPTDRTGLYLIPLLSLTALLVFPSGRWTLAAGAVVCAAYLSQFEISYYVLWRYNEGARAAMALARSIHAKDPSKTSIGLTWQLEPSVNFYRVMDGLAWMPPATRAGADGLFDYYLLMPEDAGIVAKYALHQRYKNPISGLVLATRD